MDTIPAFTGAFAFLNASVTSGQMTYDQALAFASPVSSTTASSTASSATSPAASSAPSMLIRRQLSQLSGADGDLRAAAGLVRAALLASRRTRADGLVFLGVPDEAALALAEPPPSLMLPSAVLARVDKLSGGTRARTELLHLFGARADVEVEVGSLKGSVRGIELLADLYTEASGDCLLNALSLALFGVHDRAPSEALQGLHVAGREGGDGGGEGSGEGEDGGGQEGGVGGGSGSSSGSGSGSSGSSSSTAGNSRSGRRCGILRRALYESLRDCEALRAAVRGRFSEAALAESVERSGTAGHRGSLNSISIFAMSNVLRRPIVCLNTSAKERAMIEEETSLGLEVRRPWVGRAFPHRRLITRGPCWCCSRASYSLSLLTLANALLRFYHLSLSLSLSLSLTRPHDLFLCSPCLTPTPAPLRPIFISCRCPSASPACTSPLCGPPTNAGPILSASRTFTDTDGHITPALTRHCASTRVARTIHGGVSPRRTVQRALLRI